MSASIAVQVHVSLHVSPANSSVLAVCMIAIADVALGIPPLARMENAVGRRNLTRNLGGAPGLALVNTVLGDGRDLHLACLHLARLHERFSWPAAAAGAARRAPARSLEGFGSAAPGGAGRGVVNRTDPRGR